ncbi:hypothetical protein [Kutzneria sp. CA-103260]|uniref:hypothetical protein n=1 Tax=Kutzneria sp. CA-103260 TaxID=2802641 RepID=UPI001BAB512E|nr:hypothetical protein [Kutzneria sp. CA-103260]QUQ69587.1 hypothetical protein JJ691_73460 [Kutzneria sp. CA-103260]
MSTPGAQQPMDPAAQRTFDYAQQVNAQNGNSGWFGGLFALMDGMSGAAQTGQFAVDENTAKVINDKLTEIKQITAQARARFQNSSQMPIGGGYAQQIAQRNMAIQSGGPDSANGQLLAFANNLDALIEAINSSVKGYQGSDKDAHGGVNRAGNY